MLSEPQLAMDAISSSATPAPKSPLLGCDMLPIGLMPVTNGQRSLFENSPQSDELHCEASERQSLEAAPTHETTEKTEPQPQNNIHPPAAEKDGSALQALHLNRDADGILANTDPTQTPRSGDRERYRTLLGAKTSTFFSFLDDPLREPVMRRTGAGPFAVIIRVKQEEIELRALLDATDSFGEAEAVHSIGGGKNYPAAKRAVTSSLIPAGRLIRYLEQLTTYTNTDESLGFVVIPDTAADSDNLIATVKTNSLVPALEVRRDDRAFTSSSLLLKHNRNEERIYDALLHLAVKHGSQNDDGTWMVRVGYTALSGASGCSTKAFGRAWPRLLKWGFLRSIEPHHERQPALYAIRSLASVDAIFKKAGCTHIRVLKTGTIQPFRSVTGHGEETS